MMSNSASAIAVIPARGGSKRIPRKNIRHFCGKPIIAWSIDAAIRSDCFKHVVVSTDDPEIAEVAEEYGAEVPFVRPANLSDDYIGTIPVVAHAVSWVKKHIQPVTDVCCIYATAPFVRPYDLRRGLDQMVEANSDYALSVTSFAFPIQRAVKVTRDHRIEMFYPHYVNVRSQDLEHAWHDAGQFCWGRAEAWLEERPIFAQGTVPITLPRIRVQDIDTLDDWHHAEMMFRFLSSLTSEFGHARSE